VSKPWDPWRDGRRAVERLARWYADRGRAGADPLGALSEIGLVRRLLDEAELEAVRSARRVGRSWAEIATKLGVSRQSAWERWRDLDVEGGALGDEPGSAVPDDEPTRAVPAAVRRGWREVTVPSVVGLTFVDAQVRLAERGLVGLHHDRASIAFDDADATVTDQSPESGARLPRGASVQLWTERGGDSGVREPRRPRPTTLTGRKVADDPAEDAVG
jgi:transposase-like protein